MVRFRSYTNLPGQLSSPQRNLPLQFVLLILDHLYEMILNIIDGMSAFAVFLAHGALPMSDHIIKPHWLEVFTSRRR
jgi:hypothetical protein